MIWVTYSGRLRPVVVAALAQHRLYWRWEMSFQTFFGAFSIEVLFQPEVTTFDRSSKIYAVNLFVVTTLAGTLGLFHLLREKGFL
jgi:hypothetical protein